MRLSAPEEYGIRCLLRLARHEGEEPLPLSAISESEGLSVENAAKYLGLLRRAGLVKSVRGVRGGYRLARDPGEVTMWEVIEILDGPLFTSEWCDSHTGTLPICVHTSDCSLRALLSWMNGAIEGVLAKITLADLACREHRAAATIVTMTQLETELRGDS